ncbi:MAG: flagellar hook-basal body complex protein FliE [Gammaproteobacteria bacterium]|nr:flagellar hook-basal body complex protein FliE [Gammaproteobacteria bacterium]
MSEINVNALLTQMKTMATAAQQGVPPTQAADAVTPGFGEMLKQSIDSVNELQMASKDATTAFEMGDKNVSLAEVMLAKEKAGVAFQTMLTVRSKLIEAYKEIQNTQV